MGRRTRTARRGTPPATLTPPGRAATHTPTQGWSPPGHTADPRIRHPQPSRGGPTTTPDPVPDYWPTIPGTGPHGTTPPPPSSRRRPPHRPSTVDHGTVDHPPPQRGRPPTAIPAIQPPPPAPRGPCSRQHLQCTSGHDTTRRRCTPMHTDAIIMHVINETRAAQHRIGAGQRVDTPTPKKSGGRPADPNRR